VSHRITLLTGSQHTVSDIDAGRVSIAMQNAGLLAFDVILDGRKVFLNAAHGVLLVEPLDDDEGSTAM